MRLVVSHTIKRNIVILLAVLLAAVYCFSSDITSDPFTSLGSISGNSSLAASHSLKSLTCAYLHRNGSHSNEHNQQLEENTRNSHSLSRIARKLLLGLCSGQNTSTSLQVKYYLIISLFACTYLFLHTNIRFIHLKDGSK